MKLKQPASNYAAMMHQSAISVVEALGEGQELDEDGMGHVRAVHGYCERILKGEKPPVGFWHDEEKAA